MATIITEADWLNCDDPRALEAFARGRIDVQRFGVLLVVWGNRIRHLFNADDRVWFDAFAAWVTRDGPDPGSIFDLAQWWALETRLPAQEHARWCGVSMRDGDYLRAAVRAGWAAAADYKHASTPKLDPAHHHRRRAKSAKAAEEARHVAAAEANSAAKAAQDDRVRREFCDAFRAVAGNPFLSADA